LLFGQRSPSVALVGLGGVGKTQVALELAYWARENHPEHSIFWVPALSGATFEQAYAEIAKKLAIRKAADDEDVKESVRRHLSSAAAGPWLLVVDNADDVEVGLGSSDDPGGLSQYLPESESGVVLYTTRSPDVASRASDEVELHEMSEQEARTMLEKSLKRKGLMGNEARVKELLDELTYLPLAIAQAAAYLDRNRLSVTDYLTLLRGAEDDMVGAMSREFHDSTRYPGSQNAVATTWLVSFDQIRRTDETAAELLSFISQIEPKAIPRSILPRLESEEKMVHAIGTLCGYAFLGRREESDLFDMHSLVHVATRVWIKRQGRARETEIAAIQHLVATFPSADRANRALWGDYLPHTLRVLHVSKGCSIEERHDLSFRVGQCLDQDRRFKEAIRCLEEAYEWRKERFAEEDKSRLMSEHELASAYLDDRRITEAIEMLEHVVAVRKRTLAEEDHSRLASEQVLASAYLNDRRITEAIEMLEHVVAVRKRTLAEDDHSRLTSEHELASAYLDDRRITEAIEMLEHVVAVRKRTLAEDDDSRLASEHELARAYLDDRRITEAIEMLEHVVAVEKRRLAEEDHSRLASEQVLASAYLNDRRITEAIEMLEHVVAVRKRTLAEDDHSRLTSEQVLASAYLNDRRITEAIAVLEHVVAVRKRRLAEEDDSRLTSEQVLASAYLNDRRITEAIAVLEHVVAVRKRTLAEDDHARLASEGWLTYALHKRSGGIP
jgi:tetratricopeptide (TPR) repeat protein